MPSSASPEEITNVLDRFMDVYGVRAILLATRDGLLIHGRSSAGDDLEALAALGNHALQSAARLLEVAEVTGPRGLMLETPRETFVLRQLSADGLVLIRTTDQANLTYLQFLLGRLSEWMGEAISPHNQA